MLTYLEEVESQGLGPVEVVLATDVQGGQAVKQQQGGRKMPW